MTDRPHKLGLIAGNGRFPLLVLEEAVRQRVPTAVAAIREETSPEVDAFSSRGEISVHWLGLGQLGKLIRTFRKEGVDKVQMAGQVRHVQIFARRVIIPDFRMLRLFASLPRRDTGSLIGGVVEELEKEGFEFVASTFLLESSIPSSGVLTRRAPSPEEQRDIDYGRPLAAELARLDLGQTVVVKDQAVVAVEAMEGTNECIRRAAGLAGGGRLTVVKVGRPRQDMRFDVPVVGLETLEVLIECHVSALAIDAGKTLILDRERFTDEAERAGITVLAG